MLIWVPFACLLLPVALIATGSSWQVSLGIGALVALLAALCVTALLVTGVLTRHGQHDRW